MGIKKLSPLYIAMVLLVIGFLIHVSSTEPLHGQRKLQKSKATLTSDATTQIIHVDEMEFVHTGSMGFEFNDYPGSGANNRHTPHTEGTR